jgi:NADH-quinone oxidoreductase subunit C
MTPQEILNKIKSEFNVLSSKEESGIINIEIETAQLSAVMVQLRDGMTFKHMNFMTAIDRPESNHIETIYRLFSYETRDAVVIRVTLDRERPAVATVSDIFRTAEWHEREAAEMFGITFVNHPDPRLLLLPDAFIGHPLRKDFTHPNVIPMPGVK